MKHIRWKYVFMLGLAVAGWFWNGETRQTSHLDLVTTADAVIGAPLTPLSCAGVA